MTDPELDVLVHEATTVALMLRMGERIAYGRDADIISRQTDAITDLRRQLAEANQRADAAEAWIAAEAEERGEADAEYPPERQCKTILALIDKEPTNAR